MFVYMPCVQRYELNLIFATFSTTFSLQMIKGLFLSNFRGSLHFRVVPVIDSMTLKGLYPYTKGCLVSYHIADSFKEGGDGGLVSLGD